MAFPSIVSGTQAFANFAAFPASAPDGSLAIAVDTDSLYAFSSGSASWVLLVNPSTSVTSVGPFGSTPNADGASVASGVLTLQPADATHPGGISTTTQTLAGAKTFNSELTVADSNSSSSNYELTLTQQGTGQAGIRINRSAGTVSDWSFYTPQGSTDIRIYSSVDRFTFTTAGDFTAVGVITGNSFVGPLTGSVTGNVTGNCSGTAANVTGVVAIANGGTGQSSAAAGFNALSPVTTKGDLIAGSGTNTAARQAVGTDGYGLLADSGTSTGLRYQPVVTFTALINVGLFSQVAANALQIFLQQADGSSGPTAAAPCKIAFRTTNTAQCGFNIRTITAAVSITVPSGATLGSTSGVQGTVYVYALDNAGTVEVGVCGTVLDQRTLQSSTAISSGSTSISVLYSTTGRSNVPIRLLGQFIFTEATAGTWATAMSGASLAY